MRHPCSAHLRHQRACFGIRNSNSLLSRPIRFVEIVRPPSSIFIIIDHRHQWCEIITFGSNREVETRLRKPAYITMPCERVERGLERLCIFIPACPPRYPQAGQYLVTSRMGKRPHHSFEVSSALIFSVGFLADLKKVSARNASPDGNVQSVADNISMK